MKPSVTILPIEIKEYVIEYWEMVNKYLKFRDQYSNEEISKEEFEKLKHENNLEFGELVKRLANEFEVHFGHDWREADSDEKMKDLPFEVLQFTVGLLKVCWFMYIESRMCTNRMQLLQAFNFFHREYVPQLQYSISESIMEGFVDGAKEYSERKKDDKEEEVWKSLYA